MGRLRHTLVGLFAGIALTAGGGLRGLVNNSASSLQTFR